MPEFSDASLAVLSLLRDRHNVLLSGPPGTGKTRLLSEVARAFERATPTGPVHVPGAKVSIPKVPPVGGLLAGVLPSPARTNRKVFRTVFHQNSKYRDFVTGLVPAVGTSVGAGATTFRVVAGTLFRASEHALSQDGAALLIIDEINRGPAVQVFGGSIVAFESNKRLAPDGSTQMETQKFEVMVPNTGDVVEYALPDQLYILAAMNQADTSVEPLDVAFLRRWAPFRLEPSMTVLREFFGLRGQAELAGAAPTATTVADVYEAAVRAWKAVNDRIRLGRGSEFQIGHGVLMSKGAPALSISDALIDVAESWQTIRAHVDEVFFGDVRGIAAVLNVGVDAHPYRLNDATFADEPRLELVGPAIIGPDLIYPLLTAVAG